MEASSSNGPSSDSPKSSLSVDENYSSRVVHVRNLPPDVMQNEIIMLAAPFGTVEKVVMLNKGGNRQALVQLGDLNSAVQLVHYYTNTMPAAVRGRPAYVQFSRNQELTAQQRDNIPTMSPHSPPERSAPVNRILLATVHNPLYRIDVDVLYQVFSPYGMVEKIVIFNKSKGLQALVQYTDPNSAVTAKEYLNGQNIYAGSCTLSLQYSNLTDLTVKTNSDKTRDFANPSLPSNYESMKQYPNVQMGMQQFGFTVPGAAIPGAIPGYTDPSQPFSDRCVLLVSNLPTDQKVNCDILFNLFSNYGYVVRIKVLHNKPDHALVQLGDYYQAATAASYLNGITLFGKQVDVNYSKHSYIASTPSDPNDLQCRDFSHSPLNRFTSTPQSEVNIRNYKNMCGPTSLLHISNLSPSVSSQDLTQSFSRFGEVQGLKFFETFNKRQALVQLDGVNSAIEALATLHNSVIEGQRCRVSFSKNKI